MRMMSERRTGRRFLHTGVIVAVLAFGTLSEPARARNCMNYAVMALQPARPRPTLAGTCIGDR